MTVLRAAALAGVVTLGLAGCTGGDAKSAASPTPTSSSSSAPGVLPAAAKPHTEAGAVAFATFYVLAADKAYVSQDAAILKAHSAPSCAGCQSAIEGVGQFKAAGQHQLRPSMTVLSTKVLPTSTTDVALVEVQIRTTEVDVQDASGAVVGATDGGDSAYQVTANWTDGHWSATAFGADD